MIYPHRVGVEFRKNGRYIAFGWADFIFHPLDSFKVANKALERSSHEN